MHDLIFFDLEALTLSLISLIPSFSLSSSYTGIPHTLQVTSSQSLHLLFSLPVIFLPEINLTSSFYSNVTLSEMSLTLLYKKGNSCPVFCSPHLALFFYIALTTWHMLYMFVFVSCLSTLLDRLHEDRDLGCFIPCPTHNYRRVR